MVLMILVFISSPYTNVSNPNISFTTPFQQNLRFSSPQNPPLNRKEDLTINDFSSYPIVTTRYLIEKNDYRMINLLPFAPKGIEIVESYDDIPIDPGDRALYYFCLALMFIC